MIEFAPKPIAKPASLGGSALSSIPGFPSIPGFSSSAGPSQSGSIGGDTGGSTGSFILGSPNAGVNTPSPSITSVFRTTGFQVALVGFTIFTGALIWRNL